MNYHLYYCIRQWKLTTNHIIIENNPTNRLKIIPKTICAYFFAQYSRLNNFSPFVAGMHAYLNISMNNEYTRHHHVVALFLSSCFSHDFTCKQVWTHKQDIIFRKIVFTLNMKWKMIFLSSTWCSLIYRRQNKMNRKNNNKKKYWICMNIRKRKLVEWKEWKSFVCVALSNV